ncbi:hypothetical protein [Lichenifustis flavocetrariae]|uniref:Uncharacterized protein n=1 Tax=Lichenifustis flavocetrariae TaxID=2949735 RepID=A0AA42CRQ1_9HYPH|nr:hypothetical protein [Lichenifustis flavocetrariae]MCW6512722.1 hypothetical protein [Lichenifustis flavocetrariae]
MFAILRQAGGRRYEVDFEDDAVVVDVAMNATTVQITMTAADDDDPEKKRFVTVAVPREALITALAVAGRCAGPGSKQKPKLVS